MAAAEKTVDLAAAMVIAPVPIGHWLIVLPVVLCLGVGAALLMLRERTTLQACIAIAGLALLVVIDGLLLHKVAQEGPLTMAMGRWLPPFGIAFTVDIFGAAMALALLMSLALASARYTVTSGADLVVLSDRTTATVVSIAPTVGNIAFSMKVKGHDVLWWPSASLADFKAKPQMSGVPFLAPWAIAIVGIIWITRRAIRAKR